MALTHCSVATRPSSAYEGFPEARPALLSTPLNRGKRTMVWQTRLTLENGRAVALVTQTQMVLEPK